MKKTILTLSIVSLLMINCSNDKDPFLIHAHGIGDLTTEIKIKQLDSLFAKDSIVKPAAIQKNINESTNIELFEKGGVKLLEITPKKLNDPDSKISNIQIFDNRYQTEKGVHLNSTFKDLKDNYTIKSIMNTLNSLVISLEESDAYVIIDKEVLSDKLRSDFGAEIVATDIPDTAPFKFFMVGWESNN